MTTPCMKLSIFVYDHYVGIGSRLMSKMGYVRYVICNEMFIAYMGKRCTEVVGLERSHRGDCSL